MNNILNDSILTNALWIIFPAFIGVYGYLIIRIFKTKKKRLIYKGFFRAVISIVERTNNSKKIINEIKLNFRKLAEKNPSHKEIIRNPTDLLEELVYNIDKQEPKRFKEIFGFEISLETRDKIIIVIDILKEENPFVSLPPKEGNLLTIIKQSIETNNTELGISSLNQLSDQIEILDSNMRIQEKRNINAYIVSVIGVLLTIVFGIITLIQSF
jgi:hypothetical protein